MRDTRNNPATLPAMGRLKRNPGRYIRPEAQPSEIGMTFMALAETRDGGTWWHSNTGCRHVRRMPAAE